MQLAIVSHISKAIYYWSFTTLCLCHQELWQPVKISILSSGSLLFLNSWVKNCWKAAHFCFPSVYHLPIIVWQGSDHGCIAMLCLCNLGQLNDSHRVVSKCLCFNFDNATFMFLVANWLSTNLAISILVVLFLKAFSNRFYTNCP